MSRVLPRLVLLCAGLALSVATVSAQTPPPAAPAPEVSASHLLAARDLMDATGVLAPLDELIPSFGEQVRKQNVTRPELTKDLDEVLKSLEPELELQRREVTARVARTYAKWFTEDEMKELLVFFRSPLGAKFNKVQPDLVEEVVGDVGAWTQEVSEYVMIRTRAEMGKRGQQMQ